MYVSSISPQPKTKPKFPFRFIVYGLSSWVLSSQVHILQGSQTLKVHTQENLTINILAFFIVHIHTTYIWLPCMYGIKGCRRTASIHILYVGTVRPRYTWFLTYSGFKNILRCTTLCTENLKLRISSKLQGFWARIIFKPDHARALLRIWFVVQH